MTNIDRHITKRVIGVVLILASLLIVAACGTATNPSSSAPALPTQTQVTLNHAPIGTSDLTWDAASQALTVKIALSGLAPNSTHPEHIHKGDCSSNGDIAYKLNPLTANSLGVGTSVTTIPGVKDGIPANGWYVNVHNGPGLSPDIQFAPIACANITNPTTSTESNQSVHLTLEGTTAANESANGTAQLSIDSGKLTVKLTLTSLTPNSKHIAHIHKGSCEAQGPVLYTLTPVVADVSGKGTSTTVLPNLSSIPAKSWYVNVHLASTMDDLNTQTGFDPIACGNVVV
jgi:hypothetical protein